MNSGRSDASTSTDDINNRPLCLFYFTHPFGVLSPEPPTLAAAPAHIARAFVNMEPVSPFTLWGTPSDDSYNTSYNTATTSSQPSFELGNTKEHQAPKDLMSVARTRKCTLDFGATKRDTISSSLFSNDMWFNSSSSCKSTEYPRRLIPYNKILPPLRLPSPLDSSNVDSSEDLWPKKCLNPEKFSLPPIELPAIKMKIVRSKKCVRSGVAEEPWSGDGVLARETRVRRRLGVSKPRRPARPTDLRRLLAMLMRRAIADADDDAMGLLDMCPNVDSCCCINLLLGVFMSAVLGIVLGAFYLFVYSVPGARMLYSLGAPRVVKRTPVRYVHGIIGLLLAAACVKNIIGAVRVVHGSAVVRRAGHQRHDGLFTHALVFGVIKLCVLLLSLYFFVVVINFNRTLPGVTSAHVFNTL